VVLTSKKGHVMLSPNIFSKGMKVNTLEFIKVLD
jgi:hypothetical protein